MTGGLSGPGRDGPGEERPAEPPEGPVPDEAEGGSAPEADEAEEAGTGPQDTGAGPLGLALPGIADGAAPIAAARKLAPRQRLNGVVLDQGRAVGLALPPLSDKEILGPWRGLLGRGALYVRCVDRHEPLPVAQLQRLARVGELWLDGPLPAPDELLDHLVSGVHRFVVWLGEVDDPEEVLAELGDAAALGWSGASPWEDAVRLAKLHAVPVIATADPPPAGGQDLAGLEVYRTEIPGSGRFEVRLLKPPEPASPPGAETLADKPTPASDKPTPPSPSPEGG